MPAENGQGGRTKRLNVVLYAPRIAQNTGQIARMCFAMDVRLHLIRPLGFSLAERDLRRAGVGYWERLEPVVHASGEAFLEAAAAAGAGERQFFVTKRGRRNYAEVAYREGDWLVFGNETEGLPGEWLERFADRTVAIPMANAEARCLNLAGAAHVVTFEALRQIGLPLLRAGEGEKPGAENQARVEEGAAETE